MHPIIEISLCNPFDMILLTKVIVVVVKDVTKSNINIFRNVNAGIFNSLST